MLRGAVVLQVLIHVLLECVEVGALDGLLACVRAVDRVEDFGLVHLGGHALVVVGHPQHGVRIFEVLLQGVHTRGDHQAAFAHDGGVGLDLGGRYDLTRVGVHQRELLAFALRAFDLQTKLQLGDRHALVVRELDVLGELAAALLVHDRIVVVHLGALVEFRGAGDFAALKYHDGSDLDHRLGVIVFGRERYADVSGDDAVVEHQHLGGAVPRDVLAILGHLLEAVATREGQCGDHEHHAQFHQIFHMQKMV